MNLFTKQKYTHRHRKQTYGYQRRMKGKREKLGVWDWQIHIITYKIDTQQGLYSAGNFIQCLVITYNGI